MGKDTDLVGSLIGEQQSRDSEASNKAGFVSQAHSHMPYDERVGNTGYDGETHVHDYPSLSTARSKVTLINSKKLSRGKKGRSSNATQLNGKILQNISTRPIGTFGRRRSWVDSVADHHAMHTSNSSDNRVASRRASSPASGSSENGHPEVKFVNHTVEILQDQIRKDDEPKKKRTRTTPEQLKVLQRAFVGDPMPNSNTRSALAKRLGMSARAVQVWFQNRRAKGKLEAKRAETGGQSSTDGSQDGMYAVTNEMFNSFKARNSSLRATGMVGRMAFGGAGLDDMKSAYGTALIDPTTFLDVTPGAQENAYAGMMNLEFANAQYFQPMTVTTNHGVPYGYLPEASTDYTQADLAELHQAFSAFTGNIDANANGTCSSISTGAYDNGFSRCQSVPTDQVELSLNGEESGEGYSTNYTFNQPTADQQNNGFTSFPSPATPWTSVLRRSLSLPDVHACMTPGQLHSLDSFGLGYADGQLVSISEEEATAASGLDPPIRFTTPTLFTLTANGSDSMTPHYQSHGHHQIDALNLTDLGQFLSTEAPPST